MNLSIALENLTSPKPHRVHNALLWIRSNHIKHQDGVARLRQHGGVHKLLAVVQKNENHKQTDMALSILANCAMENASRTVVRSLFNPMRYFLTFVNMK